MIKSMQMVTLLALAGVGVMLFGASGCTPEDMQWMYRQTHTPSDYNDMPLGTRFDSRPEVAQLKDQQLRDFMTKWLDYREQYLKAWKAKGELDPDYRRLKNLRSTLWTVIQDRANQLGGQDLVGMADYRLTDIATTAPATQGDIGVGDLSAIPRQTTRPADYDDMPLGPRFDTREKVLQLKDERLREFMSKWFDYREQYLKTWREKGDLDPEVRRFRNLRSVLRLVIQDRATQVGEPGGSAE